MDHGLIFKAFVMLLHQPMLPSNLFYQPTLDSCPPSKEHWLSIKRNTEMWFSVIKISWNALKFQKKCTFLSFIKGRISKKKKKKNLEIRKFPKKSHLGFLSQVSILPSGIKSWEFCCVLFGSPPSSWWCSKLWKVKVLSPLLI